MELDFETVKALSSRKRIQILNEALQNESTPTELSNAVDRSKSTVSSHLRKLQKAGLLEKEKVEGRRRVVYHPTDKTKAIINGKDQKVKFSILSSISTAWIGLGLILNNMKTLMTAQGAEINTPDSNQMGTMALEKSTESARGAVQTDFGSAAVEGVLYVGIGFLMISIAGLIYGLVISRIGK